MVDLFLVAEKAGEGFCAGGGEGGPEVDCEVVACGYEAFGDLAVDGGGFFKPLFCFFDFLGFGGRDVLVVGVVVWFVVCCAKDEVGG